MPLGHAAVFEATGALSAAFFSTGAALDAARGAALTAARGAALTGALGAALALERGRLEVAAVLDPAGRADFEDGSATASDMQALKPAIASGTHKKLLERFRRIPLRSFGRRDASRMRGRSSGMPGFTTSRRASATPVPEGLRALSNYSQCPSLSSQCCVPEHCESSPQMQQR
jgi:hypothetical protein